MRQAALRPPEPPRREAEAQRDPQHPLGCPQPGEAEIPPKNRGLNTWSLPLITLPFVPCFVRHPAARGPSRSWCFGAVFHLLQSTSSTTDRWEMTFSGCPALLLALSCITTVLRGGEGAAGCWRSHSPPRSWVWMYAGATCFVHLLLSFQAAQRVGINGYQRSLVSQLYPKSKARPEILPQAKQLPLFSSNSSQLSVAGMESAGWAGRARVGCWGFGVWDGWERSCCAEQGLLLLLLLPIGVCPGCEAPDPHRATQSSSQRSSPLGSHQHHVCSTRYSGTQTGRAALGSSQATPCFGAIFKARKDPRVYLHAAFTSWIRSA